MINVERLLSDHRVHFDTSGPDISRGWIGLRCVFCKDHGTHLGIHLNTGAVSCWKCGKHRLMPTLARLLALSESDTVEVMRKYESASVHSAVVYKRQALAKFVDIPKYNWTEKALDYLGDRFIEPFHIREYKLFYGGNVGEWAHRIVIPVLSGGEIVAATGRTISPKTEPRYYNLPIERSVVDIKHTFLGMDLCLHRDHVVLVEGPFDAIKGGPGVISGFGASLTDEQLLMLTRFKRVTLLFDSDETGRRKSKKIAEQLQLLGLDSECVFLDDDSKDLGGLPHREICNIRSQLDLEDWHAVAA